MQVNVLSIIIKYFLNEENSVFDLETSFSCRLAVNRMQGVDVLLVIA